MFGELGLMEAPCTRTWPPRIRRGYLGILLFGVYACASTTARNERGLQNVSNRAEFDLSCPRDQLRLAPLQYDGDLITSYAVIGCSKRATYLRAPGDTFVLDKDSQAD